MSKERDLLIGAVEWMQELKYLWTDARNSGDRVLLELIADINKIEQFLAQPEQTEQQPEAWILEDKKTGYRRQSAYKPTDLDEEACNVIPLYTAPPKREPLNIEEIHNGLDGNNGYDDRFVDGVRFAEKAHGIGE